MHHILWRVPWPTLMMMVADQPRYVSGDELRKRRRRMADGGRQTEKGQGALEFFQTQLND